MNLPEKWQKILKENGKFNEVNASNLKNKKAFSFHLII